MNSYLFLGVAVLFNTLGNVLLRIGMDKVGPLQADNVFRKALKALQQPEVLVGVVSLAGYFFCYGYSLIQVDVSLANPLTAMNIVLGTIYANFVLGEQVSRKRWLGLGMVALGGLLAGVNL